MQLRIYNQSGGPVEILEQEISNNTSFTIPAESLLAWCGDLTLRMLLLTNLCQVQDANSNGIAGNDAQALFKAIIMSQVGTS